MKKIKNYQQLLTGMLIGLIAGLLIAKLVFVNGKTQTSSTVNTSSQTKNPVQKQTGQQSSTTNENTNRSDTNIPSYVFEVLKYIRHNGKAMENYVGGRVFSNREKKLPQNEASGKRIFYQEWDVHPKIPGKNRGTERICTGSEGRAWYTNDHYKSFKEIK